LLFCCRLRGKDTEDLAVKVRKTLQNFREEASGGRVAANRKRKKKKKLCDELKGKFASLYTETGG
jgi:hypothetical protein